MENEKLPKEWIDGKGRLVSYSEYIKMEIPQILITTKEKENLILEMLFIHFKSFFDTIKRN